jgi:NAD(P)-dependent dehydrogenase (short-subunit alcohol dehydrogenase family)/acyl carrier protein
VCTRGAVAVAADEAPAVMQAPLRALAGSAAFEHPELACVRVDLDPRGDAVAALVREIEAADGEDEVAWRGGRRLAPRLRAAAPGRATAPAIRGDATYLVTGGLRGLGLAVAGWLVGRGARHLALLGRSAPDAAAAAEISAWTAAGVQVHVRAVDVGDAEALAATLAGLEAAAPPLAGVFHAAGVVADATLLRQDWDRCWTVMAPKLVGAWTLDRATRGRPLDCFVLFSSMAAVTGAPGQANYAAANAFLDALAARRRAAGLAATSVGWGPWAEIGMAADAPARARPGLDPLTPAEGLRALERAVAGGAAHVVVVKARWPEFLAGAPARPRVFADLAPETGSAPADARAEVLALAGEARRERALEHVRAAVAAALGSAPAAVPARAPLRDLGMDSLMAVQIRNAINGAFALQLPATLLFEQPTAAALCDCVLAALVGEAPAAASAPVHDRAAEVEEMSEDEVEALLLARLRTLEAPEG